MIPTGYNFPVLLPFVNSEKGNSYPSFRQGIVQLAVGLALGLVIAGVLANLMQVMFFDVDPFDPVVWVAIVVMLLACAR